MKTGNVFMKKFIHQLFKSFSGKQRRRYYITLRACHMLLTAVTVVLAQIFARKYHVYILEGDWGLLITLYALAILIFSEQFFYPVGLWGAFLTTGSLCGNMITSLASSGNLLFSAYATFFAIVIVQALIVISLTFVFLFNIPFPDIESKGWRDRLLLAGYVLILGSPFLLGIGMYTGLFTSYIQSLPESLQKASLTGLALQVGANAIRIGMLPFRAKFNDKLYHIQKRIFSAWQPLCNIMFFIVMLICFGISFFKP